MRGRRVSVFVVVGILAGGALAAPAGASPSRSAPPSQLVADPIFGCDSERITVVGDHDRDGRPEVVVGVPWLRGGAVAIAGTNGSGQLLQVGTLAQGAAEDGDSFGFAVEVTELNGDRCADLVIGAPGRYGRGAVYVVLGFPYGYPGGAKTYVVPAPTDQAGARFGASLSLFGPSGSRRLAVGMPGLSVDGQAAAGGVAVLPLSSDGAPGTAEVVTEQTADVSGVAEAGDRWGSVLADGGTRLLVGVPDEDNGSRQDAGTAGWLSGGGGLAWRGRFFSQDSAGVPGTSEAGDRFGANVIAGGVIAGGGTQMTVGSAGEAIGSASAAGSITSLRLSGDGVAAGRAISQNATYCGRAVPGTSERGDRFGASLAWSSTGRDTRNLLVGSPGEDFAAGVDAGAVTSLGVGPEEACVMRTITESSWPGGYSEPGDRFGASLASGFVAAPGDARGRLSVVRVGVPGEKVHGLPNFGAVGSMLEGRPTGFTAGDGNQFGIFLAGLGD